MYLVVSESEMADPWQETEHGLRKTQTSVTNTNSEIRREILRLVTFPCSGVPILFPVNLNFITSSTIPSALGEERPVSSPVRCLLG